MGTRYFSVLFKRLSRSFLPSIAVLVAITGFPALFGWNVHAGFNTGLFSHWNTMQFNTAVGMAGLGLTLLLMTLRKFQGARILGAAVSALGGATLIQHVFGVDLGIDQLLRTAHNTLFQGHPGRMAPNTAVSFISSGLAVLALSRPQKNGKVIVLGGLLGVLPTGLGLVKILNYLFGVVGSLDPGSFSYIALPEAFGLTLSGSLVITTAILSLKKNPAESFRVGPLCLIFALLVGTIFRWQILLNQEMFYSRQLMKIKAEGTKSEINGRLQQISFAMKSFASRVEYLGFKDKVFLNLDTQSYLEQLSILKRIGLIDNHFNVTWSYPLEINNPVKGFNQAVNPLRQEALVEALRTGEPTLSRSVDLLSGEKDFILPLPLHMKMHMKKNLRIQKWIIKN